MNSDNAIDLLFGSMEKLGPGDDTLTLDVLKMLPRAQFKVVVDAGCGAGRQTLVLAKQLNTLIQAVDSHKPFLRTLEHRAKEAGMQHLVETHCMDMTNIPTVFPQIDLLWSEGAAYNIGFVNALASWASAIVPGGFVVVSELSWLTEDVPTVVKEFFQSGYPEMQSIERNRIVAQDAGFQILKTHTLPRDGWIKDYYDVLGPRAKGLLNHPDESVRAFAAEALKEIEIFSQSENSYGYVFYVLQR